MEVFVKKGNPLRFLARLRPEDVEALTLVLDHQGLWFGLVADAEGAWAPSDREALANSFDGLLEALKYPKEIE